MKIHPVFFVIFFFGLVSVFNLSTSAIAEQKYLNPPPAYIEYMHFGFRDSLADSIWLRWIQDNDYCQTYGEKPVYFEVKNQSTPTDSLLWLPRHKICENSWSFKMLDAVTKLAPRFAMPYLAGASTLAILVEDFEGATEIYERGLKLFPADWQLLYRASFHYQYNLKDIKRAAELLIAVADLGGPIWARSLAARLYTRAGQIELGLSVLEAYRKTMDLSNKEAVEQVDKRILELRAKAIALPKEN